MKDFSIIESIILYPTLDLNHSSYVLSSIQEFSKSHSINYIVKSNPFSQKGRIEIVNKEIKLSKHSYEKVTYVSIKLKKDISFLLAFDFNDSNVFFSSEALNKSDFYFKRTFTEDSVKVISDKLSLKIYPMGIPFMHRPDKILHLNKIKKIHLKRQIQKSIKFDKMLFSRLQKGISKHKKSLRSLIYTRKFIDFENHEIPKNPTTIFYQKRFFPNENSEDTKLVHQQRIDIVRLLKKEFSNNFKGGIKDDENLPNKYKDCTSTIDGSQSEFLKTVKESGICIYTRGLSNSIGWTLPEFMSQGKAIIAEYQSVVFPKTLKHNVHLLYFESVEELRDQIHYLLNNPDEIKRLSNNARQYYEENISPTIFFESILKQINA